MNSFNLFQVAIDDKDSILASIPADLRDKGSELYASLVDGKVNHSFVLKLMDINLWWKGDLVVLD